MTTTTTNAEEVKNFIEAYGGYTSFFNISLVQGKYLEPQPLGTSEFKVEQKNLPFSGTPMHSISSGEMETTTFKYPDNSVLETYWDKKKNTVSLSTSTYKPIYEEVVKKEENLND